VPALRTYLRISLPEYMIPSLFVVLEAFPLTANKKVDRAKLPDPDGQRPDLATEPIAPRTETEATLARIWEDLLDVEQVGTDDNFFDLGGHSLLTIQVQRGVRENLGCKLPLTDLFRFPTVRALAAHLSKRLSPVESSEPSPAQRRAEMRRSAGQRRRGAVEA